MNSPTKLVHSQVMFDYLVDALPVIAECAEDEGIVAELRMLKVDYAQGFGRRRPAPIDELLRS